MTFLFSLFDRIHSRSRAAPSHIFFSNTLSGKKDRFIPLKPGLATLYSCGPTVYSRAHIGNLRGFVLSDTLARTLQGAGYRVRRVINITDVGHLVDDVDQGEDKMAVGAAREKKTPAEIADQYTHLFLEDIRLLGIDTGDISFPRATEYITEQIALARTLEEKGFAYRLPEGLYFDTEKFNGYGKLGGRQYVELEGGKRVSILGKRHPNDFALWRSAKPGDLQQWDSPWGRGNPGWHLECSAMSRSLLGNEIDIHTGGEDLANTHHNNEIAQSEAANGRTFVRYWMHTAFLSVDGQKISKSLGNTVYLSDIIARRLHPLSLRYFFLQAHYRTPLSFTWEAIGAAHGALARLWRLSSEIKKTSKKHSAPSEALTRFTLSLHDDLSTPQALGLLWESLKSDEYTDRQKWGLIERADALLGLSLANPPEDAGTLSKNDIPGAVLVLLEKREEARAAKRFEDADRIRTDIENRGYHVEDAADGPVLTRAA